jgi:hypothetical protein
MSLDIQEAHRNAIVRMLQLKASNEPDNRKPDSSQQWKVLIYDKACQDIIAPIMKVCCIAKASIHFICRLDSCAITA